VYLKRLDILGFKSFANKTTVRFSDGLTAIVGPNGCGKTNILDALRWVLGEQRPTLLRGGKMDEVIFNGTQDTKPLGMSEVTLSVVNDRGVLPTEYNEIQITRRLFRSGDSEYLLNKTPCRLKDITDLFADTGMGAHSYSVIQQDMIDSVISDRAEERRFLFEEAAGITKYKQRRKAALRKLEATENDFLRLKDIHAEVKTRVNSLYRQHKKAERYQRIAEEIKNWELYLASIKVKGLDTSKRELKSQSDSLSNRKLSAETELNRQSAELESHRSRQIDLERKLNEIGGEVYSISEKTHSYERELLVLGEKKNSAETLITRNNSSITELEKRLETLIEQTNTARIEIDERNSNLEAVTLELSQAESAQAEADRRLMASRTAREEENRRLIELEGKLSSERTEGLSLQEQIRELAEQVADIDSKVETSLPRQKELLGRLTEYQGRLDSLLAERSSTEKRKADITQEMETLTETGEELSLEVSNLKASIEAAEARHNLLQEMMLHYEGYESGVVTAMEDKERWPGIAGTVAEKFVPVEGMESAVEAALGDVARFLICYDRSTAEEIINHVRTEQKGRIGILVPDTGALIAPIKRPAIDLPEVVGWLDSFVSTEEGLQHLKDAVLCRTIVFKSGADPKNILERLPHGFAAVSTDGVVYRSNIIFGGSDDRFPLFRRRERIQEQEKIISELTERLATVQDEKNRVVARFASARAGNSETGSRIEELAEEIETVQKEAGEIGFEHRSLTTEFERLDREKKSLSSKLERIRDRQCNLDLDTSQLSSQKDSLVSDITLASRKLDEMELEAVVAGERVSKLQVACIEVRSKVEQTSSHIGHLKELKDSVEESLSQKKSEIESAQSDIHNGTERMTTVAEELKAAFQLREEKTKEQESLQGTQAELFQHTSSREKDIKELRTSRDTLSDNLHELEIRINTIDSEMRSISSRILEEYETDVNSLIAISPDEKIIDDDATAHLTELKEKLKKFGAVNLLALDEYREADERERFLDEQIGDLETAASELKSTISRINQTARNLFNDTLEKVQTNFKNLFVELFSGGEARIQLVDPNDPLESDIEIIARPRGKKLLSITMMSGGERALTAIALLFSLYLVKPSPFCILDEIDAPLDDANCHRFLRIIRTFSRQTQFVIITHNKITMEASNNLYGITMEQPGISKLVAVRFASDNGDDDTDVRLQIVTEDLPSDQAAPSIDPPDGIPEAIKERLNPQISVVHKEDN